MDFLKIPHPLLGLQPIKRKIKKQIQPQQSQL